jgi:uridylate kinase
MGRTSGYRRAVLKISGEALAGTRGFGLDREKTAWIAGQIARCCRDGREISVVVGGGNIMRGVQSHLLGVPALVGDHMGMIATVLNALALRWALEGCGVRALAMSAFPVGSFIDVFDGETARSYLESGSVVIFAGGTGNPCFTTDSAASLRAVETDAKVMVKATQVSGVYDKDPKEHPDAVFFDRISPREVLARGLEVLDATSVEILSRKRIPVIVLDLHQEGNLARALDGEKVGTLIAHDDCQE